MNQPFQLLQCSWPQPVVVREGRWASEPDWDAPAMPVQPTPRWQYLGGELCWTIDWRDCWRSGIKVWNPYMAGEMSGFHVVFHVRAAAAGTLAFWDDDGSIVRRNGRIVHEDRSAHAPCRHEIAVAAGDLLEIAQWQLGWDWIWGARLIDVASSAADDPAAEFHPRLGRVEECLRQPNGPPLKVYTDGRTPLRAVLAIHSFILNGQAPSAVLLFGEEQWPARSRDLFRRLLPFARVVTAAEMRARLQSFGVSQLADWARRHWFVMKTCVGLLYPPGEACLLDDDIFVLDRLDDALAAFQRCDLVYAPDQDLGAGYRGTWTRGSRLPDPLPTARFNAGLYWIRPVAEPSALARRMLAAFPNPNAPFLWEQGFIACAYADRPTLELPRQRYLFPLFDGLPGGMLGYDYAGNPCRFAMVHFGGLAEKPSDSTALQLAGDILDRSAVRARPEDATSAAVPAPA